jgi:hypothetical protein
MAQEFKTFTQRLTDSANQTTTIFNVDAKTIVDGRGNDVIDAKGNKIWFPVDFDPAAAIAFGKSLAAKSTGDAFLDFFLNVSQGGPWELQRSYNGVVNGPFASVFTPAASYAYGLIGASAGFSQITINAFGGLYNIGANPSTMGWNFGNNPNNTPFINQGFGAYLSSSFAPSATIPANSFQENPAFAVSFDQFQGAFGHSFSGSSNDFSQLFASVANGTIVPSVGFTNSGAAADYTGSFLQTPGKIVVSAEPNGWFASMVRNGEVGRIIQNNNDGSRVDSQYDSDGRLRTQEDVFTNGTSAIKYLDTRNIHPYSELDFTKGADGKVATAQIVLDQRVIDAGGSIGQIFGSALGSALGGKDQLTKLTSSVVGGTIGSLIGQKFGLVVATSMAADLSKVSLTDVFALQNIDIAAAGIGAVSSFLTAELGNALQIPGFGGQLFNAAANGFTLSVLTQVKTSIGAGLTFEGAIAAIDWSGAVSGAIGSAGLHIENLLGSYLGQLLVPAKSHEGAIGGQLLGAIGSLIVPGLGTLLGTILGTVIGDLFGNTPHPAAVDLLTQAGGLYGFTHYQTSASDGGAFSVPDQMADPALAIINAYLGAVKGAALDHSKQVTVGYLTDPSPFYIDGVPSHPVNGQFLKPDGAVQAAVLDVLQHTEVIGGDLLMKRAHPASIRRPHPYRNRSAKARRVVRGNGWRRAQRVSASVTCIERKFA